MRNRAEVRGMFFSEENQQALLERHGKAQRLEGKLEGELEAKREIAANMLRLGEPVEKVARCCGLEEDEVRFLAEGINVIA